MSQIDTKALFIGPYGENGHEFRQLVLAVLEDIIQWRRKQDVDEDKDVEMHGIDAELGRHGKQEGRHDQHDR